MAGDGRADQATDHAQVFQREEQGQLLFGAVLVPEGMHDDDGQQHEQRQRAAAQPEQAIEQQAHCAAQQHHGAGDVEQHRRLQPGRLHFGHAVVPRQQLGQARGQEHHGQQQPREEPQHAAVEQGGDHPWHAGTPG